MSDLLTRLGLLILIGLIAWLLVWTGRRFIERQRRLALSATPPATLPTIEATRGASPVSILAFSSADCRQCHQLQAPALQRVVTARKDDVTIVEVDATTEHDLVQAYRILTVPSTVILDTTGNAHAINYGFANTQRLITQVDEALAKLDHVHLQSR